MPTSEYQFHAMLNTERAFTYVPMIEIDYTKLPKVPKNWLSDLELICRKQNLLLTQNLFDKHLGNNSTYTLKAALTSQLQIIYYRLRGDLDEQLGELKASVRVALISKLLEEIKECTGGFHNRVNVIVGSLQMISSLDQLVSKARKSLVEIVSAKLTGEVHASNRVTLVAQQDGLGVKANLENDPHRGNLTDIVIKRELNNEFNESYTPFSLPFLLVDELRGLLASAGYEGKKSGNDHYTIEEANAMVGVIAPCLQNTSSSAEVTAPSGLAMLSYFVVEENDDGITYYLKDINWPFICQKFFEILQHEGYIKSPLAPISFRDHVEDSILRPNNGSFAAVLSDIKLCFEAKTYELLQALLKITKSKHIEVYEQITKQPMFEEKMKTLVAKLSVSLEQIDEPGHERRVKRIVNLLDAMGRQYILPHLRVLEQSFKNLAVNDQSQFIRIASNNPEIATTILTFMIHNQFALDHEVLTNLFTSNIISCRRLLITLESFPRDCWPTLFSLSRGQIHRVITQQNEFLVLLRSLPEAQRFNCLMALGYHHDISLELQSDLVYDSLK